MTKYQATYAMVLQIVVELEEDDIERAQEEARLIVPSLELANLRGRACIDDTATLAPMVSAR
jgi:hypothetical protein